MTSPSPGGNPNAPEFIPEVSEEFGNVSRRLFGGGASSQSHLTPPPQGFSFGRPASPFKRARADTSPAPRPIPCTNWSKEFEGVVKEEGGTVHQAVNYLPKTIGALFTKLESIHSDAITALTDTVRALQTE